MTGVTTGQVPLLTATDSDDTENFLTASLVSDLQTLTNLFDSTTGHTHSGPGQGGPIGGSTVTLAGVQTLTNKTIDASLNTLTGVATLTGVQTLTNKTLTAPTADAYTATGLTGSVAASRYVGATTSGAPTTGAHLVGDFVVDQTGKIWVCTVAGTPGTWVQVGASVTPGLTKIAEVVLGASAATIDFSAIPGTYRHLQLECYLRGDTAATSTNLNLRFNGDTGANYDNQLIYGTATSITAAELFGQTVAFVADMPANTAGANLFGAVRIDIPHYANAASNKLALCQSAGKVAATTGNLTNRVTDLYWRSNAAITQVTLSPAAGNFVSGSLAVLLGVG